MNITRAEKQLQSFDKETGIENHSSQITEQIPNLTQAVANNVLLGPNSQQKYKQ